MSLTISVADIIKNSKNPLLVIDTSWERIPLGEVAKILNGFAFKSELFNDSEGMPLIRIRDIGKNRTDCYYNGSFDETYVIKSGDLLIGMDGDFNCSTWNGPNALLNQRVCKIEVNPDRYNLKFLEIVLPGYLKAINEHTSSQTVKHLSSRSVAEILLPNPPLAEQQRIVSRVEVLLTHVNAARYRLNRVPLIMKKFRQAVLAAACSGRLTEGWREGNPDVESGSDFLARLTESRKSIKKTGKTFEDDALYNNLPELPDTWTWSTIQQTVERVTVGHVGPMKNEYQRDGIPFLRCQNVRENRFESEGLVYISPDFHAILKKSALEPNDLVVVRSGNVGTCCVIPTDLKDANCSDLVIVKKPFSFIPELGAFYINSIAQKWISDGKVGIALSHFNTKSVANLPIPIAPLAEQHEIVRRVGLLFERADAIDREVDAAGRQCERMTQAVLGNAFAGRL